MSPLKRLDRDNEDERILDLLVQHPDVLIAVAPKAVNYPDNQARWQIAVALGRASESEAWGLLQSFIGDSDDCPFLAEANGMVAPTLTGIQVPKW